jgi:IS30 family transposase
MGTHYRHLKLDERRKLAKWLEAKMPISEIADRPGRDPSTIYRDIKRNRYTDDEVLSQSLRGWLDWLASGRCAFLFLKAST